LKIGPTEIWNPPYPYSRVGTSPFMATPRRWLRKSGSRVPSAEVTNTCSVTKSSGSHRMAGGETSRTAPSDMVTA
jgi:hypothetical protein